MHASRRNEKKERGYPRKAGGVEEDIGGNCANSLQRVKVVCDPATTKTTISGSTFLVMFSEVYSNWQSLAFKLALLVILLPFIYFSLIHLLCQIPSPSWTGSAGEMPC